MNHGPKLAVDCIILVEGKVLLIHRRNPPRGWALPGGFVEYGETVEDAVRREMKEETGLDLQDLTQFRVYSDPRRDSRGHVVSVVFTARGMGKPEAGDDADRHRLVDLNAVSETELVFDHAAILGDFRETQAAGGSSRSIFQAAALLPHS
ncbi:NUDIX hydrolase [candidate division WOR-3 bacterium]|uniref:NUDIX hydrolase n=1 Tax=candidate division WOR-3 bacterium TaxID=2052148 RepID=A0A938BPL4_UNCW3|nr:NUDIX hydrolase [candidate division WOR-3 bacterium]